MHQNGDWEENGDVQLELEEGNNSPKDNRRRVSDLTSVVSELMRFQADPASMEPRIEGLIPGVVEWEVELARSKQMHLFNEKRGSGNEMCGSKSKSLQLKFLHKVSTPVLTGKIILGEEYSPIGVALVDEVTGQVANTGLEASAKLEIVVLDTSFTSFKGDNWTFEEFDRNIARERQRNRPFLVGDVHLNLKEGIGIMGEVHFAHTKCWMAKREFRLGARMVDTSRGIRVREAITETFIVEDRRGKLYVKHYPPSLSDAVWRLEKIGKDGAFHKRLSDENINSVEDFLTLLNIDPQRLKNILGTNMSGKMWKILVDHAQTCVLDKRAYLYHPSMSQQKMAVIFNVVWQLKGVLVEQQFVSVDNLPETEMAHAQKVVVSAFQHRGDVVPIDIEASLMAGSHQLANAAYPSNLTTLDSPNNINFGPISDRFDAEGNSQQDTSTGIISLEDITFDDYGLLGADKLDSTSEQHLCFQGIFPWSRMCEPIFVGEDINNEPPNYLFWSSEGEVEHAKSSSLQFTSSITSSLICDTDSMIQICDTDSMIQAFCEDEHFLFSNNRELQSCHTNSQSLNVPHKTDYDIPLAPSVAVTVNKAWRSNLSKKNARIRWGMLSSVMKWFSVRRNVARKPASEVLLEDPNASSRVITNSSIYSTVDVNSFDDECCLQFQNLSLESQADLHSAVNDIMLVRSAVVAMNKAQSKYLPKREKAQRRWRVLFSVMRWFSVKRNAATNTAAIQNSNLKAPANLHNAVNDVTLSRSAATSRKYLQKRSKAQRRWRMLFSLASWFSVRKNVTRKAFIHELQREMSASSQEIMSAMSSGQNTNDAEIHGMQTNQITSWKYEPPQPGLVTNSLICDSESIFQEFCQ